MEETRVEEGKTPGPYKLFGVPLTVDFIFKAAALLVTATLLYANMNNNAQMLGVKIDNKYELINSKLENFEWRMKRVEDKLDSAERRDFDELRRQSQKP